MLLFTEEDTENQRGYLTGQCHRVTKCHTQV